MKYLHNSEKLHIFANNSCYIKKWYQDDNGI